MKCPLCNEEMVPILNTEVTINLSTFVDENGDTKDSVKQTGQKEWLLIKMVDFL